MPLVLRVGSMTSQAAWNGLELFTVWNPMCKTWRSVPSVHCSTPGFDFVFQFKPPGFPRTEDPAFAHAHTNYRTTNTARTQSGPTMCFKR